MRRQMKTPGEKFESEAALCAAFIAAATIERSYRGAGKPSGWTAYPETAGWDILLVRSNDGFQIGIEAKLDFNVKVLTQALKGGSLYNITASGPDCRAVLVPEYGRTELTPVAHALGITVIRMRVPAKESYFSIPFQPYLPRGDSEYEARDWFERMPETRHKLPDYIPDVIAGASGPVMLTPWKVGAIKLAVLLERRGHLTRRDFKELRVSPTRWMDGRWLVKGDAGWIRGEHFPDFKAQHPRNYAEIAADFDKWMPKETAA